MTSTLRIGVDPSTLLATVHFESIDPTVAIEITLVLRSRGNRVESIEENLRLPWNLLKRVLRQIFKICKRYGIVFQPDEHASKLIESFAEDYRFFEGRGAFISIARDEIQPQLDALGFERSLTSFQLRDVERLLAMRHGANFSVPGAGKTTTLLALYVFMKSFGLVDRLFVVAPINAFISWEEEIGDIFKVSPLKTTRLSVGDLATYSGVLSGKTDVFLINYEKLRRNIESLFPFFQSHRVHFILDEAHRIKGGENNQSYNEIIKLADIASRKDILTGTPMPQHCNDLDPQYEFLWNQKLLPESFRGDPEDLIILANQAIDGRFTRTTKAELQLTEPIYIPHDVTMGPIQSELYDLIRSESARSLANLDFDTRELLRGLQRSVVRLMQAATNPMLLGAENAYDEELNELTSKSRITEIISEFAKFEKPAKIEFLRDRVTSILSANLENKVVIWSYFVRNIWLVASILKDMKPVSIYGAVPSGSDQDETKREGILRKFKTDPECRVLIANPQACGEGISLHKVCHNAIYLDRSFNAAHFLQSVDRIHRIGLPDDVDTNIEIISASNTIDEIIDMRLRQKAAAMGAVLDDPHLARLAYDPADIEEEDQSGLDSKDIEAIASHLENK